MYKKLLTAASFILVLTSVRGFAQVSSSLQINGGLIMPFNSSKGFTASVQYNYPVNASIQLYAYTGYSAWDKHNVKFHKDWSTVQMVTDFSSYDEDSHILIPFYVGVKFIFNTGKLFFPFINVETGYSYYKYNSYENNKMIGIETGEIISYFVDENTKKINNDNLFGIGFGAGITRPLTDHLDLILAFKLNTTFSDPLGTRSTYTALTAGIALRL